MNSMAYAALFLVFVAPIGARGDAFLGHHRHGHTAASQEDFQAALAAVMGDDQASADRLANVKRILSPMWLVLPKNKHDNVEWGMVRYLAHRYFMQTSSLLVRGFEPIKKLNATYIGAPAILGERVSSIQAGVQSGKGFTLDDVTAMVAALEELIAKDEHYRLQKVYKKLEKPTGSRLQADELSEVLGAYMVHWMVDEDDVVINALIRNPSLRENAFPKWQEIGAFAEGMAKTIQFQGRFAASSLVQSPQSSANLRSTVQQLALPVCETAACRRQESLRLPQRTAFDRSFSFDDALRVVNKVTTGFASFWENECQIIKESLVALDKTGTGRVGLSEFYGANVDGEWRFGESEAYLRDLGALDESNPKQEAQVIIPNYLQGASNCIIATSNYLVCCVNECEEILNDLEAAVGASVTTPEHILGVVANMSGFDDEPMDISSALRTQMLRIAETHGGQVPLHGRLFAQWLHYAFPRECPFPHKSGTASAMTPSQYGDSFVASPREVESYAAARDTNESRPALEEDLLDAQFMSQWAEEEELLVDYSLHLQAPWEGQGAWRIVAAVLLGLVAAAVGIVGYSDPAASFGATSTPPKAGKAHYV